MSLKLFRNLSNRFHLKQSFLSRPYSQLQRVGIQTLSRAINVPGSNFNGGDQFQNFRFGNGSLLASLLALTTILTFGNNKAENCGIVGVVGSEDASGFLLEGLTILRNRGYDSAGIATIAKEGEEIFVTKFASRDSTADSIDLVRNNSSKHAGHVVGIGHTRWATHGGKTDFNAHPHTDQHHRIALIHNGTINNAYDLKKELQDKGIKFSSETDTEVIAQLVGVYLDKGFDTKEAVRHALGRYLFFYNNSLIFILILVF